MNRQAIPDILADLDDVITRLHDAGLDTSRLSSERFRLTPPERLSYPPSNGELRRKASEHFAKAREFTSEAVRRLRRDG